MPSEGPVTGEPSATQAGSSQQAAANQLAALLSQSVSDRSAVNAAYNDVLQCGPTWTRTLRSSRTQPVRASNCSAAGGPPVPVALSSSMLQDLSSAWQVSVQVDGDYQQWAQDQASAGCAVNSTTDPNYVAAEEPNNEATADKTAFIGQWNSLAGQFGLTQYQQGNL